MKKLFVLSFVCVLAIVLCNVCVAQPPVSAHAEHVIVAAEAQAVAGPVMPAMMPGGPFPGGYAGCASPCANPCYGGYGYGYGCGYGGYGYGYGCGPRHYGAPVRNLLHRIFAPRPYCGYDAYYGPYGDFNNGCYAPCNTPGRCW